MPLYLLVLFATISVAPRNGGHKIHLSDLMKEEYI